MTLTPEQKKTVTEWVAAGEGLSAIQTKLRGMGKEVTAPSAMEPLQRD